jgi:polyisoprenoid-binding protein YceI
MKNLIFLSTAFLFLATSCTDTPEIPTDPTGCECYAELKSGKTTSPIFDVCMTKIKADPAFKMEYDKCHYSELTGKPVSEIVMPEKQEKLELKTPADANYIVDIDRSDIRWTGKKITGDSHSGSIKIKSGNLAIADGKVSEVNFVIDMASIKDRSVKDEADRAKLEGHLKSADFFDVQKYPEATFKMTRSEMGTFKGEIYGDLTIKGKTNEVKVDVVLSQSGGKGMVASGTMFFDRTQFDVKYGSGTIFTDIGDKAIRDNVPLSFSIVASEAK